MLYYLLAIFLLTIIFAFLHKAKIVAICPVCAATVITWATGLLAIHLSASWANSLVVAVLMGASMGAVAEKYGKYFGFLWKTAFILLGLAAIYFLVQPEELYKGLMLIVVLGIVTLLSNRNAQTKNGREDLFKDCC